MIFNSGEIFAERYQLIKQLGVGSFGEVWLAKDLMTDDKIAVKFYRGLDQNGIDDFKREFKLARSLRHTNLLNLSYFDVFKQCPYLVMDFCSKGSAAQLRGNVSETRIWEFIRDVSAGLSYLHSRNTPVIHQDIKLGNILIDENDRFIVTDFGISKKIETHMQTFRSVTMESSGTLAYMSPERFKAPPVVVKASDMWSLGMCVYELVTGQVLWEFGGSTQLGGAEIPSLGGNYSPQLSQFFQRCLAVNAWERPTAQDAYEEAKAKLNGGIYHSRSVAPSVTPVSSSAVSSIRNSSNHYRQTSGQRVSDSSVYMKSKKNHDPTIWEKYGDMIKWGGGAVLLFVLALGVFSLLFSGDDNSSHSSRGDNPYEDNPVGPKVDPIIPVDTPDIVPVIPPTPKPPFRGGFKQVSPPPPKPVPVVDKEEEFWKECKRKDERPMYNRYLNEYRNGKHRTEARKRIQEIDEQEMNSRKVSY